MTDASSAPRKVISSSNLSIYTKHSSLSLVSLLGGNLRLLKYAHKKGFEVELRNCFKQGKTRGCDLHMMRWLFKSLHLSSSQSQSAPYYVQTSQVITRPCPTVLQVFYNGNYVDGMVTEQCQNACKQLTHPNILKLYGFFPSNLYHYLVVEFIADGMFLSKTFAHRVDYSELHVVNIVRQLLLAVEYLHERDIVHRHLRIKNLLSFGTDAHEKIKLTLFGDHDNDSYSVNDFHLTHITPEAIYGNDDSRQKTDMWDVGVIIYTLLCGYPPIYADNDPALFRKLMSCTYSFDAPEWNLVSAAAKDLILHLIVITPSDRISASQALVHPWFDGQQQQQQHSPQLRDALRLLKKLYDLYGAI